MKTKVDQKGHRTTYIIAESIIFRMKRCSYDSILHIPSLTQKVWQAKKNPLLGAAICGEWGRYNAVTRDDATIAQIIRMGATHYTRL